MRERQRAKQLVASILSTFWEIKQFNTFLNDSKNLHSGDTGKVTKLSNEFNFTSKFSKLSFFLLFCVLAE